MFKIKGAAGVSVAALGLVVVALVVVPHTDVRKMATMTCNPLDARSCLPSVMGSQSPSEECCSKLKDQVPSCYCKYIKDTKLKPYIDTHKAKKVAGDCGLVIPTC